MLLSILLGKSIHSRHGRKETLTSAMFGSAPAFNISSAIFISPFLAAMASSVPSSCYNVREHAGMQV